MFDAVEVYDPLSDTWSTLPRIPTARYGPAVAFVGGRLHVVGGAAREFAGATTIAPVTVNEALCHGIVPYRYDANATDADGDAVSYTLVRSIGLCPPGTFVKLDNGDTAIVLRRSEKANHPLVASLLDRAGHRAEHGADAPHHQGRGVQVARARVSGRAWRGRPSAPDRRTCERPHRARRR